MKRYFVNKQTGRRYEIVRVVGSELTLKGEYNEFTVPADTDIKKLGYKLEAVR